MIQSYIQVLSTRKISESNIAIAHSQGIAIVAQEWVSVQPVSANLANKLFTQLSEYLVFTSAAAANVYATYPPVGAEHKVYCLAGKTREILEQTANCTIVGTATNAESLATTILKHGATKTISFITGNNRLAILPNKLVNAGMKVNEITVYTSRQIPVKCNKTFSGYVFFSPSAVEAFFSENSLSANIPCFCVGNTTMKAVKERVLNPVFSANFPSELSIIEMIINYFKKNVSNASIF